MTIQHKEYLKKVGIEIKVARVRANMNREQLAAATGMSAGAIAKIEGGKRDGHILSYKRLADALGIALKDVL